MAANKLSFVLTASLVLVCCSADEKRVRPKEASAAVNGIRLHDIDWGGEGEVVFAALGPKEQPPRRIDPEADLFARVQRLTGPAPAECGRHIGQQDWLNPGYPVPDLQRSLACVWAAAGARRPVWMLVRRLGFDSWVAHGLFAGEDGVIHQFQFDDYPPVRFDVSPCMTPVVRARSDTRGDLSCGEP